MPSLIADALACVDEELDDWLELRPLDPAYRAFFPDGSSLDVIADADRMAAEVHALCGARDATGYRRFAAFAEQVYRLERDEFIDRNIDSPLSLLSPSLARLVAIGGFRRLAPVVGSYVRDPRLRRVLSFQSLYAGVTPQEALAIYASIPYLDSVAGVSFPVGGMHAVPRALAGAAVKHGVEMRYDADVTAIEMRGSRAIAVRTAGGDRIAADAVVVNADLPAAWDLIEASGGRARRRRMRWSPSCVLLLAGARGQWRGAAHHNLHFGNAWRPAMRAVRRGELMSDPSLLVSVPTVTDTGLAPAGRSSLAVVAQVPKQHDAPIDWQIVGPRLRDELVVRLEQFGYTGLGAAIEVERLTTPADWAAQGLAAGTPFSAAHVFRQTGPFRPGNLVGDNVVLAGCGTRPGIGVPMVLLSGRLAAERIVGPVR
jgi:phytoene desaturase